MRKTLAALALAFVVAVPAAAQGVMSDFHTDLNDVQKKFLDLAKAMPEASYSWRPSAPARSVGELLMHVGADNYLIPVYMGKAAPAATGVTGDYNTAVAYEKRTMTRDQIIAQLEASFTHLHQALALTTEQNMNEKISMFGREFSRHNAALVAVGHLHEHLGQFIAYARANNITPPWSR